MGLFADQCDLFSKFVPQVHRYFPNLLTVITTCCELANSELQVVCVLKSNPLSTSDLKAEITTFNIWLIIIVLIVKLVFFLLCFFAWKIKRQDFFTPERIQEGFELATSPGLPTLSAAHF